MKKVLPILLGLFATVTALGQASFTGEYTNNFDSYVSLATLPTGWTTGGSGGFVGAASGSGTTGGFYSFFPTCCSSEHSLGALHSGSATGFYQASFTNNTSATITSLFVSYDFEQYRAAGNTTGWDVQFNSVANAALGAAGITSGVTTGTPYVLTKSTTITGLSIAVGATFTIKWTVNDASGSDNPVAIDNFKMCVPGAAFTVSASNSSPVTEPAPVTLTGSASSGTTPYTYSWSGPLSFSSAAASPVITPSSVSNSGLYTLLVTDAVGCTASASTTVTVNPGSSCSGTPVSGTASASPSSFCVSGTSTVTVTGASATSGLTYQWQSSATGLVGSFTNISGATNVLYPTPTVSSTTYYRLVTTCSGSGLSDTSTIAFITINPLPAVGVSPAGGSICSGGSGLSMTASGASTYSWAPSTGLSATAGATVTANPTATTTYTITGTSASGCVNTSTVTVTYNLAPSAITMMPSSVALCTGGTPQLLTTSGGIIGPTTVNSGSITIPGSIGAFGTIADTRIVAGIPAGATITGATVNIISFGSQFQDDYVINIKAPNGNVLNLINQRGTHTSTVTTLYGNTQVSSSGVTSLASGSGTFTGIWAADALSGVGAAPYLSNVTAWSSLFSVPNGSWTLSVYNNTSFSNVVATTAQWSITLDYAYQPVTWAPTTGLYTDASATVPYTGGMAGSVYVNPAAPATTTYTATATNATCSTMNTVTVTVNPLPAAITGTATVCAGLTTTLADATSGGTWGSSATGIATVSASGVVTGVAAGNATITYTLSTGCFTTTVVTVNPLPSAITGTLSVCVGGTTTLADATTGGAWSSSVTGIATVDAAGVVSGVTAGNANVTYTLGTGCIATAIVTVNPLPLAITGTLSVCEGLTTTLADATTGGTWTSSTTGTATISAAGVVTGVVAGNTTIAYTLSTGCFITAIVTVNPLPSAIAGTLAVCEAGTTTLTDATTGGTWSSGATGTATVDAGGVVSGIAAGTVNITYTLGTGCLTTAVITVNPLPSAITGILAVCEGLTTTLADATTGGTWTSSATGTATISAAGVVTGVAAGNVSITYTLSTGCFVTAIATVNPLPSAIAGTLAVCEAGTTTLTDATAGGTWSSGATGTATIDAGGVVSGIAAGTVNITYTLGTGCITTAVVTVNPLPSAITGILAVCEGLTTTLADATIGGTWTSSATGTATISVAGVLTGVAAGNAAITYTLSTGCFVTAIATVNPLPSAIAGTLSVCEAGTTTLTNATTGGTWSSGATGTATISASGVVSGVLAGTVNMIYTLGTGCIATAIVTVNPLPLTITGTLSVCQGLTTTLADATTGGTWTSSTTSIATVSVAGVVTGVAAGNATITYTLSTGCFVTAVATVNPLPSAITGTLTVCEGSTTTLANATMGGAWSSSAAGIATIDAAGIVSGIVAGTSDITYTLGTGCIVTAVVTVNPLPSAITGTLSVCQGLTTTLADATTGGTWTSSAAGIATISAAGVVTGVAAGNATITYALSTGCFVTAPVTVNPLPSAITGIFTVCEGSTTTLADATTAGTWSSSATGIATIDAAGVVSGVVAGTATITYTIGTGCIVTAVVTVNPLPMAITGTLSVCPGLTTTLADATTGGVWTSSATGIATVSAAGVVTGVAAGNATITYTLSTGCFVTAPATVNPLPSAITGALTVCTGLTTTLGSTPTGGTWTSSNGNATIGATTGITSGVTGGTSVITYALSTGCVRTAILTVNASPAAITGTAAVCQGLTTTLADITTGGTWSSASANATIGATTGIVTGVAAGNATISYILTATGCYATRIVTVNPLPGAISGPTTVCVGSQVTLTDAGGGTWASNNGNVTIGLSSGIVTGVTAGTSVITYTLSTGCIITRVISINPLPSAISGTATVCVGSQTTLSNTGGGTWSTSSVNATVGLTTGVVGGLSAGNATITYTLSTGCATTRIVTVNPLPGAISGTASVCVGLTTTLADAGGGTWASSNGNAAIGASTGILTGVTAGNSVITYTLPTGCLITRIATVNPLPAAISGTPVVCVNATTTLSNTGGGTWTSSNTNATIGLTTGILTGATAGTSTITYTLSTGCIATVVATVNALPTAYMVTGGGVYCAGGTGVTIGLSNSATGIDYQLYNGTSTAGSPVSGAGGLFSFGTFTAAGTYTVLAVNAATGCANGMTGSTTVVINPLLTPEVSLSASTTTFCTATAATFTASPVNGGTIPVYQWRVNGAVVGTSAATYAYTPVDGDIISVKLTSNAACATPDTAIASDTLDVISSGMPSVTIVPDPSLHVCAGTSVLFAALPVLGGPSPAYRWTVNDTNVATGPTFTYIPLNGDVIYCKMFSNFACRLADSVTSPSLTLIVDVPIAPPVVAIAVTPGTLIAAGETATFTATVTGGGAPFSYQWLVNGSPVAGATGVTFETSTLADGDSVTCVVTGSGPCGLISFNSVSVTVVPVGVGVVSHTDGYVQVIPNPNNGIFTLKGKIATDEDATIEIVDMIGHIIYKGRLSVINGSVDQQVNIAADLANGMYMLHARSRTSDYVVPFVIAK